MTKYADIYYNSNVTKYAEMSCPAATRCRLQMTGKKQETVKIRKRGEDSASVRLSAVIRRSTSFVSSLQRNPIEGTGEPPMLRNGYANAKCWFSFMNLTLLSMLLWTAVCEIVGNDDVANTPSVIELAVVGNAIAEPRCPWPLPCPSQTPLLCDPEPSAGTPRT